MLHTAHKIVLEKCNNVMQDEDYMCISNENKMREGLQVVTKLEL